MRTRKLELIDGKKIIAPEQIDITNPGYFDEMEYMLWNTIKGYLSLLGIQIQEKQQDIDEPDWATVKTVEGKIIQVLQEAGVNFKTDTVNIGDSIRLNLEFPVILEDIDIDIIMQEALNGGIARWCDVVESSKKAGKELHKELTKGGIFILHDCRSDNYFELTKDGLINGFRRYLALAIPIRNDILEFIDYRLVVDAEAIDSKVADAIVQYAVFGEVYYYD